MAYLGNSVSIGSSAFAASTAPASGSYTNLGSYDFDGAADYGHADGAASTINSDTQGTITAWIRPVAITGTNDVIFNFGNSSGSGHYCRLSAVNGKISANHWAGGWQWIKTTDNDVLSAATWVHIAVVQDGVSPVIYVNGVAVAQSFSNTTDITTWASAGTVNTIKVGRLVYTASQFFDGHIDDIAYFRTALSAANVATIAGDATMNSTAQFSPFLHYRMDAQTGTSEPSVGSNATALTLAADTGWDASEIPS